MALDVLNWTKENREDVNFVMESKLLFSPTSSGSESNWRRGWTMKMVPVSALLVTLGRNSLEPPPTLDSANAPLQFPTDTGVRRAAMLLIREKNSRYSMVRVSFYTNRAIFQERGLISLHTL